MTATTAMPNPVTAYVLDVPALYSWSQAAGNEFQTILDAVKAGNVVIFNRAWDSFKKAYPEDCDKLPKDEFSRARFTEEHRLTAAEIAEVLEAKFPIRGGYDDAMEWQIVGIAKCGPYTIVTDERRKVKYLAVDGLIAITYEELLDQI